MSKAERLGLPDHSDTGDGRTDHKQGGLSENLSGEFVEDAFNLILPSLKACCVEVGEGGRGIFSLRYSSR